MELLQGSEKVEVQSEKQKVKEIETARFFFLLTLYFSLLTFPFFIKGFLRISITKCIDLYEVACTFFQVLFLPQVSLVRSDKISEVLLMNEALFAEG